MPLLALLPLFGISAAAQRRFGISASLALMLAISAWLTLAFIAGLAGVLWWVSAAIWLVGLVALFFQLPQLIKRWRQSPPLVYALFTLFCLAFWLVHHSSQYFYFDEYAHWGVFIKDMWTLDGFWDASSNALHLRYPPGTPLWQYTFGVFAPHVDSSAYFAQFVLLAAPLMTLFERLRWQQIGWVLGITITCIIGLANFGHGIASLYVDHLVATWLLGILLAFVVEASPSFRFAALLALPLLVLSLLKDAGIAFSLAAAAIVAAIYLARRVATGKRHIGRAFGISVLLGITLIAPSAAALKAWSMNRDAAQVPTETQSLGGVARGVVSGERALSDDETALISERFKAVFLAQQISKDATSAQFNAFSIPIMDLFEDSFRLTTASAYLVFALYFLVLIGYGRLGHEALPWALLGLGLIGTAVCYSATLYFSYLFAFGERGLILSSYVRYTHSIVLTLFLMVVATLVPATRLINSQIRLRSIKVPGAALALTALISWMMIFETPYLRNFYQPNPVLAQRVGAEKVLASISDALDSEKLWVFFPVDQPNGFLGHLMQFQLAPTPTVIERSATFFEQSPEQVEAALSDFDILWFPVQDPALDEKISAALGMSLSGRFVRRATTADGGARYETHEF